MVRTLFSCYGRWYIPGPLMVAFSSVLLAQSPFLGTIPVAGALTDTSVRFAGFCLPGDTYVVQRKHPATGTWTQIQSWVCPSDSFFQIQVAGLMPASAETLRILHLSSGSEHLYTLQTLPSPDDPSGYVSIAFGSCLGNMHAYDPIFRALMQVRPHILVYTGDWLYPDAGFPLRDTVFFGDQWPRVIALWKQRFSPPSGSYLEQVYHSMALDYVWDDHDFTSVDASRKYVTAYRGLSDPPGTPPAWLVPVPQTTRLNVFQGYWKFFPHYPLPDSTEGVFHRWCAGPVCVYILDVRSARHPHLNAFVPDTGGGPCSWRYDTLRAETLSILGDRQKQWLWTALSQDRAYWRVLVSSVVFSQYFHPVIRDLTTTYCLLFGDTAIRIAMGLADQWAGFLADAQALMDTLEGLGLIERTVVVSGDIHTSVLDTSRKGGLYEMVAGNLGQENSRMAWLLDSLTGGIIRPWDLGQGIGKDSQNFSPAFGWIQIFGWDSLKMCLVDTTGTPFACYTLRGQKTGISSDFPQYAFPGEGWSHLVAQECRNTQVQCVAEEGRCEILRKDPRSTWEGWWLDIGGRLLQRTVRKSGEMQGTDQFFVQIPEVCRSGRIGKCHFVWGVRIEGYMEVCGRWLYVPGGKFR